MWIGIRPMYSMINSEHSFSNIATKWMTEYEWKYELKKKNNNKNPFLGREADYICYIQQTTFLCAVYKV